VHRDIKPQNVIISQMHGCCKLIDLGAAADLRIGLNYIPDEFLLDPRYAPPQQYIMSPQTVRCGTVATYASSGEQAGCYDACPGHCCNVSCFVNVAKCSLAVVNYVAPPNLLQRLSGVFDMQANADDSIAGTRLLCSCVLCVRRAPPKPVAALLSPVLWRLNTPDRFDMYSVGILFMQLVFAPLRPDNGLERFNKCASSAFLRQLQRQHQMLVVCPLERLYSRVCPALPMLRFFQELAFLL